MSGCISERLVPGYGSLRFWPCCQDCRYRKSCPYEMDELIYRTARQGQAAAKALTEKADRLRQTVACSGDIRSLLNLDTALEEALCGTLRSEMVTIDQLCVEMKAFSP